MMANKLASENKVITCNVITDSNNLANLIIKKHARCPNPKPSSFIIQLPRAALKSSRFDEHEFCIFLERLADGLLETTKYQGASLQIERPWCFVYSNDPLPPRWIQQKYMTEDRWKVMVLGDLSANDKIKIAAYEASVQAHATKPAGELVGFV